MGSDMKYEIADFMENIVKIFQQQNTVNPLSEEQQETLELLQKQVGPAQPPLQKEIQEFTFQIPEFDFDYMMERLGSIIPKPNIHYIETSDQLLFNTNAVSYTHLTLPTNREV